VGLIVIMKKYIEILFEAICFAAAIVYLRLLILIFIYDTWLIGEPNKGFLLIEIIILFIGIMGMGVILYGKL